MLFVLCNGYPSWGQKVNKNLRNMEGIIGLLPSQKTQQKFQFVLVPVMCPVMVIPVGARNNEKLKKYEWDYWSVAIPENTTKNPIRSRAC